MPNDTRVCVARRSVAVLSRLGLIALACLALGSGWGCGFVPTNRLNDSQKLSQSLQAETSKLKDAIVRLRAQNQELARRSSDDLRTMQDQAETIKRLETSIVAYQKDREQMAAELDRIRQGVRAASLDQSTPPESGPLQTASGIASRDPERAQDHRSRTIQIPLDRLVKGGAVTIEGRTHLEKLLQELSTAADRAGSTMVVLDVLVPSVATHSEVRPVSLELERSATDARESIRAELIRLRGDRPIKVRSGSMDEGTGHDSGPGSVSRGATHMAVFHVSEI